MDGSRYTRAELIERVDFSEDLAVFRFDPEESLDFVPGQYATIGMEDGDKKILRPYSVVSAPHERELEFFLELVPDGALTQRMWPMEVGDPIWIRKKIVGRFTLDTESERTRHLMAATVTGVAPYVSMARAQVRALEEGELEEPYEMTIIHGASRSWELGTYRDELESLAEEEWLEYVPTISRPWEDEEWDGEVGRVEDVVRKYADRLGLSHEHAVAYACGHPQMIDKVKAILRRARFDSDHLHEEKYFMD